MSREIIDAFLADPQNAELKAYWESLYPDPRDRVFIEDRAYKTATGFDNLIAIFEQELEITREVMARSPKLFESGKPGMIQVTNTNAFPARKGETAAKWQARLDAEAKRLGVNWVELMVEAHHVTIKYWELQTTWWYVFAEDRQICSFFGRDRSQLYAVAPDGMSLKELENVIQGLRLLRTPFNGAVV